MIGIDHEYIAENAVQGDTPGDRPNVQRVYCEIMQMGACKLDKEGREVGVLNLTVRAHRIHTIPRWLSKMTGMTAEKRVKGVSFPKHSTNSSHSLATTKTSGRSVATGG